MSKHISTSYDSFLNENAGLTAKEKIKAAIGMIFIGSQFFGPILLRLWVVEDKSPRCKTMYTNGSVIAYSPTFVDTLKVSEVAWVLVHEIMHNVLLHFSRMKPNAKMWNYATDFAINLLIEGISDKFKRPAGALYDTKYAGLSAEVIYAMLQKDQSQMPQNFQSHGDVTDEDVDFDPSDVVQHGQGGDEEDDDEQDGQGQSSQGDGDGDEKDGKEGEGSGGDGKEGDDAEEGDGKEKVGKADKNGKKDGKGADDKPKKNKITVKKASDTQIQSAVQAGLSKAPDAIRRYYESLFEAQIDWKKELKKYIKDAIDGTKYKLPYRRFIHTGTYLSGPIRKSEKLDSIVIVIDTSGSINDALIKTFMSEVAGVLAAYPVENMFILSADDKVRTVNKLKNPRLLPGQQIDTRDKKINIKGGGGTDFEPAFQWIDKELKGQPNVVIYLTDLEGHFPAKPKYEKKVVWCTIVDHPVPFGKKINIKK